MLYLEALNLRHGVVFRMSCILFVLVMFLNLCFLHGCLRLLLFFSYLMFEFDRCVQFNAVSGLLVDHQDMHLSSLMIGGMHLMQFMPWMVSICSCKSNLSLLVPKL